MRFLAVVGVAVVLLANSAQAEITDAQLAALKIGATTYAEIVGQFGRPMTVETASDGARTITYSTSKTHVKAATFIPVVGLFAGGARGDVSVRKFEFDVNGVLTKTTTTDTSIHCNTFGGCHGP